MKYMHKIVFGIGILLVILLIQPASAIITVNATDVGETYIQWTWDGGLNLTDILIDGSVICGYETTNASIILAGLNPSELHSITVLTDTDSGSNSTYTLAGNCTHQECTGPPTLTNATLIYNPDISNVMTNGNSYTSMRLYYAIMALFVIFLLSSLFLNGESRPFEKLFMALMAFITSVVIAISSFSLAIVSFVNGGNAQQNLVNGTIFHQQYTIPTIIMQNTPMIEIVSCILAVLCFINIINCILTLIEYSRIQNTIDRGIL